jgi:glutamate-1-semialdehyde aminotransferase
MGKLDQFAPADRERIKTIACVLVEGMIANGEIPQTEDAIRAAMPEAFADAQKAFIAAQEYLS